MKTPGFFLIALAAVLSVMPAAPAESRPNVILIITDDQGHGDLGFHRNPKIRTPNMDRLALEGVRFESFHVNPVCSPTRASLLTGRYYYRTGIVDTYLGRSMMHSDEITIAQMLAGAGYRTGIFGKWHLGDSYPMRAMDKGFQESLVLNGGGLAQAGDPPFEVHPDGAYFDPWLRHNGQWVRKQGYITDIITDAAIEFIERQSAKPFFVYLPFNAPHTPLQVPDKYLQAYRKMDLEHTGFPAIGHPLRGKADQEMIARVYAMVECIDDNMGRLLAKLEELKLSANTVVIFLTDNGPQQVRYNSGMLDRKGNAHEGGIRVPFFIRWPGHFPAGRTVGHIAAHIDVVPTLLDICGVTKPGRVRMDGLSLFPLLKGEPADWPDRTLYFQWHRGDVPEMYRACAVLTQRYKIVQPLGADKPLPTNRPTFELYDMAQDALEMKNIAAEHADIVDRMLRGYEAWFKEMAGSRDFTVPPRIYLGAPQQSEVLLTRQDWRGKEAGWGPKSIGSWFVDVRRAGEYEIKLRFAKTRQSGIASFACGSARAQADVAAGETRTSLRRVHLSKGPALLEASLATGSEKLGVEYVEVQFLK
jgi:arylsulfatase A-like enzyme